MLSLTRPGQVGARPRRCRAPPRRPRTCARMAPCRTTWRPPALVATIPPTVADCRGRRGRPRTPGRAAAACACKAASVTPAPAVTWPAATSTASEAVEPPAGRRRPRRRAGTAPPTRPVLPPWGTSATPCARARATTWRHLAGRSRGGRRAGVAPVNRPVQSTTAPASTSRSVTTSAGPPPRGTRPGRRRGPAHPPLHDREVDGAGPGVGAAHQHLDLVPGGTPVAGLRPGDHRGIGQCTWARPSSTSITTAGKRRPTAVRSTSASTRSRAARS